VKRLTIRLPYFWPKEEVLSGGRISFDEEVIGAAQNWLNMLQRNFYSEGIEKLVKP
jgi:hypothetical protein